MTHDSRGHWIEKLRDRLDRSGVALLRPAGWSAAGIPALEVASADWPRLAAHCQAKESRLVALWGDERADHFLMTACYEKNGAYLLARCRLPAESPAIASIAAQYPGAARLERHCRDLLGIAITDTADKRRWTRHRAWPESVHPLRRDCPADAVHAADAPADYDYPFDPVEGEAVYEIPVGPIHAGIIEPGHFRFHAVGETVLKLEARLGYVHKGIEKLAAGRDPDSLVRLAARISGDTAVGHAWAACRALERAAGVEAPPRAQMLRALLAERERIANHLGDIGAICNDVSFVFAHMQFSRLREDWIRHNGALFGHRLLMDTLLPGGVAVDLDAAGSDTQRADCEVLTRELDELETILDNSQSLRGRTVGTGVLTSADAARLGCLGYVGRASGRGFDARIDAVYAPYDSIGVERVVHEAGDVEARLRQRLREIRASLDILRRLLDRLQPGALRAAWSDARAESEGFGWVEGWRGEIATYVRLRADGTVARFFPRDPSWFNWPALEVLIHGNIVPDFPVCNKSVNGSYSGQDL